MKKMLVVEDNKSIAGVIQRIGESSGYEVTIAYSLLEVKRILEKESDFFIATVDFSLPDAYEGQAIPYLINEEIPVIVMTARASEKIRNELLKLPIVDYITKENAQAYFYLQRILRSQLINHKIGVLVVDDSLSVRSYVASLLERRNFSLYVEPDGKKALRTIADNKDIKLVVTDYEMPGMSGVDLVQNIRKLFVERDIVILGYSSLEKGHHSARFIKSGADDYMHKPFCPEEFYCRIFKNVERLQYIEDIKSQTTIDYLTSLPTRANFITEVEQKLDTIQASNLCFLLVVFHIDHFQKLNATHGSTGADQVLIHFAQRVKSQFKHCIRARFYGAEFGLLLSGNDINKLQEQLNEFLAQTRNQPAMFNEQQIPYTVSAGVLKIEKQTSTQACIDEASKALTQAQQAGGNQLSLIANSVAAN
ncbi:response regulator [Vibrio sp. SCSIO 43136]|uniref:GGDEF domain-containing response regulator n=1 Tax=Vibrio sp. SCSIO 43136 TaxID=2819101 RepID=UPI002075EB69|nr:response regulator [Vibrio sp. SCSIO 43136]USD66437.1 response regulator [Vibrio sp. SCSIO 43136]